MVEQKTKKIKTSEKKEESFKKEDKNKKITESFDDAEIQKMLKAGIHFGHRHSKTHPQMKPFIYCMRNTVDIINPVKTKECLEEALKFLKEQKEKKALILFVGTKISARNLVKELAEELDMPYVNERWLGGTLTNFEVISKRLNYLKEMQKKRETGELKKYKKKEQIKINQEITSIERKMGGLKNLSRLPDVLFVIDVEEEKLAVKEAREKNIPVVGICDTNGNPNSINYPIPANDDATSSLKYILDKVRKALK